MGTTERFEAQEARNARSPELMVCPGCAGDGGRTCSESMANWFGSGEPMVQCESCSGVGLLPMLPLGMVTCALCCGCGEWRSETCPGCDGHGTVLEIDESEHVALGPDPDEHDPRACGARGAL